MVARWHGTKSALMPGINHTLPRDSRRCLELSECLEVKILKRAAETCDIAGEERWLAVPVRGTTAAAATAVEQCREFEERSPLRRMIETGNAARNSLLCSGRIACREHCKQRGRIRCEQARVSFCGEGQVERAVELRPRNLRVALFAPMKPCIANGKPRRKRCSKRLPPHSGVAGRSCRECNSRMNCAEDAALV